MSKENPKFGRRDFLRMASLTAAGVFFSSCALKEPTPQPVSGKSEPTPEPTIAPTAEPTKAVFPTTEPSPTPFPTEVPKPIPTETLKQKWGKVWEIDKGMGTGGPESGLTKDEERSGNFIEQITKQLEARGESLKQMELFVGVFPKPEVDAKGKPKFQSGELNEKNSVLCAYIFGKTGKKEVYCATEGEKGKEVQVGKISDIFTPEEKIWGACREKVDGSVVVSCADGMTYKTEETVFGADLTKLISEKETMTGYLFTAVAFQQKELSPSTFFLSVKDQKKLPYLPSGKEGFDMDKFIPAFDLASARFNVWESSPEKDNPYVGYWDLEKGEWRGEQGYEDKEGYQKLFVESNLLLELAKAPGIEGLKAFLENEKIVYRAKAGNPYKLEAGNYAGEVVHYVVNQKLESGLGLVPPILEVLLRDYQTLEALKERREKFPLPFDPRGMEFEMEEVSFPSVPKLTGKEHLRKHLGLRLPLGIVVYCPVIGGEFGGSKRTVFIHGFDFWTFPTLESEKELGEQCLNEGICRIEKMRTGEEIVEPVKRVVIVAEGPTQEVSWTLAPFTISFSQKSMVAEDLYKEAEGKRDVFWENREEAFLGRELFIVDSDEPARKYTTPTDHSILINARSGLTGLDNLFKIDGRYVFILPSS